MNIAKYLLSKRIQPNLKGFQYLIDAITLCQNDKNYLRNIVNGLYVEIANKNHDTRQKVERAMRHAIKSSGSTASNSKFIALAVVELE